MRDYLEIVLGICFCLVVFVTTSCLCVLVIAKTRRELKKLKWGGL